MSLPVVNCYVCGELLLLKRSKQCGPPQADVKTDGQLDGERHFSDCLSFRQRVIAKKAFETSKRKNFSFFNPFFDAIIGISLAESVENPRRRRSCVAFHLIGE